MPLMTNVLVHQLIDFVIGVLIANNIDYHKFKITIDWYPPRQSWGCVLRDVKHSYLYSWWGGQLQTSDDVKKFKESLREDFTNFFKKEK